MEGTQETGWLYIILTFNDDDKNYGLFELDQSCLFTPAFSSLLATQKDEDLWKNKSAEREGFGNRFEKWV